MNTMQWIQRARRSLISRTRPSAPSKPPSRSRRLQVECLESRQLLALTVTEFPVPTAQSKPNGITLGPDGNLWFTELDRNMIASINPTTHAFTEIPLPHPNSGPQGITTGPDGNLWFLEQGSPFGLDSNATIGELNPTTHAITEFRIKTNSDPQAITTGPDGNLWFTESNGHSIGVISPTTHAIHVFSLPNADAKPKFIVAGADGNLWFTEPNFGKIGSINPTTHAISEFPLPASSSSPEGITAGPDGNLWFAEAVGNKIGSINPTTHAINEFPMPTADGRPFDITVGPDGNLWFTEQPGKQLGSINPKTHVISEFPVPGNVQQLSTITVDSRGTLWFTDGSGNAIDEAQIPDGPTVVSVQRFGVHWHFTTLVISFDQSLDPASAQNTAAYQIIAPNGKTIAVNSAVYNAANGTVTLSPAQRINLHRPYRLVVKGTGPNAVTNSSGQAINSTHTGKPGGDYTTEVTATNWVHPLASLKKTARRRP